MFSVAPNKPLLYLPASAIFASNAELASAGAEKLNIPKTPSLISSGIKIRNWTISTSIGSILTSNEKEIWENDLNMILPEMVFGSNMVEFIHHPSGTKCEFSAFAALKQCNPNRCSITVGDTQYWKYRALQEDIEVTDCKKVYDWTYRSPYSGSVSSTLSFMSSKDEIDISLLKRPDPILFYDDVVLYEDELHDHGRSKMSVKLRVMPTCVFLLLRMWLRVDGKAVSIEDTRYFFKFDSDIIIRTHSERYALAKDLPIGSAAFLDNPDAACLALPIISERCESLRFIGG